MTETMDGVPTEEFLTPEWLLWRVTEWRAMLPLLVLRAQRGLEAGDLELADVLDAFGWSRANWFRHLKAARFLAEGSPRDARRRRADGSTPDL